jgi:hypothetical protein
MPHTQNFRQAPNVWSIVKDHLPASDAKVRRLDEFITQISSGRRADGQV